MENIEKMLEKKSRGQLGGVTGLFIVLAVIAFLTVFVFQVINAGNSTANSALAITGFNSLATSTNTVIGYIPLLALAVVVGVGLFLITRGIGGAGLR